MSSVEFRIKAATGRDASEILTLQRVAYQSEALLYGDSELPPLVQSLDDLREELARVTCLIAVLSDRIVGSVRGRIDGDTCHIGRLIVAPDLQGRGIGTRLMEDLESRLGGDATRFEVFTGDRSLRNISLYERMGYREFKRQVLSAGVTLVLMEKAAARK